MPQPRTKPDLATIGGVVMALAGIVGGLLLEGGQIKDIVQITAAIIVLGGTFGAVMVNTTMTTLKAGLLRFKQVLFEDPANPQERLETLISFAAKARRSGLVSLETEAASIDDPFFRKAMTLAIDGADLQDIQKILEVEIDLQRERVEQEAKVFESAGGYAPTIGIIGAVLGLIQVMKNLSNVAEVGHGIAVSFVATVYGVALANILFLPAANKIKARAHEEAHLRELTLQGVIGIVEGLNPKILRVKLEAFAHSPSPRAGAAA